MTERPTRSGWIFFTRCSRVARTELWTNMRSATAIRWCGSTFPAREVSAPLGIRMLTVGVCSNESGIDRSSTFIRAFLMLTYPSLSTPQEGKANETTDVEFPPVVVKLHLNAIDLAIFRVQDFSALIFIALLPQSPQNGHSDDQLIVARAIAFFALGVGLFSRFREKPFPPCPDILRLSL